MPIFEYKCTSCAAREEHLLLGSDAAPEACAACGGELKRVYAGRLGVSLEGWGFSKTDALIPGDKRGKDFKSLKERAQRIADE